ncbi:MAG: hypothetical protein ACP5XB_25060 [Isosphaeraceae bacterium]
MARDRQARIARRSLLPIALLLLSAGCREELGPEHFPTTRVSGVVVEGGRPVGGGWIEFVPIGATLGRIRAARIQPDGSFRTDGVPVGKNLIRLANAPIRLPVGRQLFLHYSSSPIRRVIPAQPGEPLRIDLLEEALRYQALRSKMAKDHSPEAPAGTQP